jgi:2-polyprenyl-3-methyl-5-hydroxy-6-metoxy-1,4-benzoquinol methylase
MTDQRASERWDTEYQRGRWNFLHSLQEASRFGIVAGWLNHRFERASLLDIGCGEGMFLRHLDSDRVTRYRGVDLAQTALDRFNPYGVADHAVHCCALEDFSPAAGERFDAIVFNEVLFHARDPYAEVTRYRQFLEPGGVMVVSFYQTPRPTSGARRQTQDLWAAFEAKDWTVLDSVTLFNEDRNLFWRLRLVQGTE